MLASTYKRDPAMHIWPHEPVMPSTTPSSAAAKSASAKTNCADFPPNSRAAGAKCAAAAEPTAAPLLSEPVKTTNLVRTSATNFLPTSGPPVNTCTTPFGTPASINISCSFSAVSGVSAAGLRIETLPKAIAGAIFLAAKKYGTFHGIIPTTTP